MWGLLPYEQINALKQVCYTLLKKIFDALGQAKVFNILNLRSSYHQLPLREGDKVKETS
jgi:hypothetical protein